jgi:hypothetical protein
MIMINSDKLITNQIANSWLKDRRNNKTFFKTLINLDFLKILIYKIFS